MLPTCDHLWATDFRWWKHHIADIARDYEGKCWTQEVQWPKEQTPEAWGITCLKADTSQYGLSKDPGVVQTGHNSGYAALGLAYGTLKASRIILLGYDMQMSGNQRHWFGAHPDGMEVASNYVQFMQAFKSINCNALGIEIWNCTRRTALDCFPIYDLDKIHESLTRQDH